MTIESTLMRVDAIRQAIADPSELIGGSSSLTGGTEAPGATGAGAAAATSGAATATTAMPTGTSAAVAGLATGQTSFASALQQAAGVQGTQLTGLAPAGVGGGTGERMVAIAESQLGQTEQPPGSNESPAIAEYRSATAGAIPGAPWCAYFASWVARQAGAPIGAQGEGLGSVSEIWSWAQSTGRAIANGPGVVPKPGDLIVFGGEHVGIVRGVLPSGQIATIEGNYENKVAANVRSPTEATGYVSMG